MSGTPKWSEADVDRMIAIIREHDDMIVAAAAISEAFGQQLGRQALSQLLANRRGIRYGQLLKKKTPPESSPKVAQIVDPVERREKTDEVSRLRKEHADLVAQVREFRARQAFLDKITSLHAPPKILSREKRSGLREMTAVVLASDWHVEEPVDPVAVNGRNEYNLEIADKRIKRFTESVIWSVEHHRASKNVVIRDMILWLGGDLMSGYIHEELLENNELSPTETIKWLLPRLRSVIATILDRLKLERIVIPCSHGNHGRVGERKIATAAQNSFEHLLYCVLQTEFMHDKRVTFEITASPHQFVQAYDRFTLRFHHGDSLKYQGGVGGLGIPLLKAVASWEDVVHADYCHVGHWHTVRDYGKALVNGSLIGYGPYSYWIRAAFEPPQQLFYLLDSKRGKTMVEPLWVGEREPSAKVVA